MERILLLKTNHVKRLVLSINLRRTDLTAKLQLSLHSVSLTPNNDNYLLPPNLKAEHFKKSCLIQKEHA